MWHCQFSGNSWITYKETKKIANSIGICAEDQFLWSSPQHVRNLLAKLGIDTAKEEVLFKSWESLPDCALLSIKWHLEDGKPFWHWVVFVRDENEQYVLDSKKSLKHNIRKDFGRIKPKWYIPLFLQNACF